MTWDPERERVSLEQSLKGRSLGFTGTYMALGDLCSLIRRHPGTARQETIFTCRQILESDDFTSETQAFFLYKKAAEALSSLITGTGPKAIAFQALEAVEAVLGTTQGYPHRASAEAIGSLPLSVHHREIGPEGVESLPEIAWGDLLQMGGVPSREAPRVLGRSLVFTIPAQGALLVVKLAADEGDVRSAAVEIAWMKRLTSITAAFPVRFDIPKPLQVKGRHVFRLSHMPLSWGTPEPASNFSHAIAFVAQQDYFSYPNDHRRQMQHGPKAFKEMMSRNAWLLGKLSSMGIIHTAPIPLFHNRVQRGRRPDHGLYEWERAGRLDQWLQSCRYPNFGRTGLRDYEHVISFTGSSRELYRFVGTHLLSLFLTVGSYFRHKDFQRVGFDRHGQPVDVRDLFDPVLFVQLVENTFFSYYEGFAGRSYDSAFPMDLKSLVDRMIEEMGVDRHMEETLRVLDQTQMSDLSFRRFLRQRGFSPQAVEEAEKGVQDITTFTGPHLGGFNEGISIPELIETVGTMAALCISGRYRSETLGAEKKPLRL
jgi:hypothetical protein